MEWGEFPSNQVAGFHSLHVAEGASDDEGVGAPESSPVPFMAVDRPSRTPRSIGLFSERAFIPTAGMFHDAEEIAPRYPAGIA